MTRFAFFTALFSAIAAKAQTIITPCRPRLVWGEQLPLCNGQCPNPECNYIAPAFPKQVPEGDYDTVASYETLGVLFFGPVAQSIWSVKSRLNRCPKCNSAFWQDPTLEAK